MFPKLAGPQVGELGRRAASAICALVAIILTAVTAFKNDAEPLLETILVASLLGFLWNDLSLWPTFRRLPFASNIRVKACVDVLIMVAWAASVPGMVTAFVYSKSNFTASKGKLFDLERVLTVWSAVLGLLPQIAITFHSLSLLPSNN